MFNVENPMFVEEQNHTLPKSQRKARIAVFTDIKKFTALPAGLQHDTIRIVLLEFVWKVSS